MVPQTLLPIRTRFALLGASSRDPALREHRPLPANVSWRRLGAAHLAVPAGLRAARGKSGRGCDPPKPTAPLYFPRCSSASSYPPAPPPLPPLCFRGEEVSLLPLPVTISEKTNPLCSGSNSRHVRNRRECDLAPGGEGAHLQLQPSSAPRELGTRQGLRARAGRRGEKKHPGKLFT